jgi:hypothetical protein
MHAIRLQCNHRFNTCYRESYRPIHESFGGNCYPHHWRLIVTYIVKVPPITTDAIIIWKIKWHNWKLKMFDAKIYVWPLQAFLISWAKVKKNKLQFNWSLTKIPWNNIWYICVTWNEQSPPDINYDIRTRLFISCDSYVPCCEMELQWSPRSPLILRKYTMETYNYQ